MVVFDTDVFEAVGVAEDRVAFLDELVEGETGELGDIDVELLELFEDFGFAGDGFLQERGVLLRGRDAEVALLPGGGLLGTHGFFYWNIVIMDLGKVTD